MPGSLVVEEPSPGVARLTISHPSKRGALDTTILDQLIEAFTSLDARCVVLTGEDAIFSAGCDLDQLLSAPTPDVAERLVTEHLDPALEVISAYQYPTIAAINGHAVGAGLELALACDLRIGADDARLGMPPGRLGLVYSSAGVRRVIETIGVARTRELFLIGGQIDAATGLQWGLLNQVVVAQQISNIALSLANDIAANAPLAQVGNKRVISTASRALNAEDEAELQQLRTASFGSEDFREGLRAFSERRSPRWSGR
jgi:enoyl-CoA hydratase/carnithine racemase